MRTSDLLKVYMTYEKSISDLQKKYIQPTKSVHPTYKVSDLQKVRTSDLQKVYIRPANSVHPTYKTVHRPKIKCTSSTYKKCTSDLQNSTSDLQN